MALIKSLELHENTIIIFSSDNGPTFNRLGGSDSYFFRSAGPFRGLKGSLYEGGIRVPLVARWPGNIDAGTVTDHISAFWDILPTFTELAGAKTPAGLDGISFAPTLLGSKSQSTHEYLYWEFKAYGGQQALRMGKWKGIRQNMLRRNGTVTPNAMITQLYDLETDPGETIDVSKENPRVLKKIEEIMKEARFPSTVFPFDGLD